jgi:hypothetical protein
MLTWSRVISGHRKSVPKDAHLAKSLLYVRRRRSRICAYNYQLGLGRPAMGARRAGVASLLHISGRRSRYKVYIRRIPDPWIQSLGHTRIYSLAAYCLLLAPWQKDRRGQIGTLPPTIPFFGLNGRIYYKSPRSTQINACYRVTTRK